MKKFIAFVLIFAALLSLPTGSVAEPTPSPTPVPGLISYGITGETVVRIQLRLRELGYFNYKPTGNFQNMTVEATKRFQQKQTDSSGLPIMADGTVGEQSMAILFTHGAQRADIDGTIPFGKPLSGPPTVTGELREWSEVKALFEPGLSYQITDYNTGAAFQVRFTGGENHAEVECATAADTAIYKEAFGGEFNYSKRPVVIKIGSDLIAASMQGEPHGSDEVAMNDMAGHACLFFFGSMSHVASLPDVEHQNNVFTAAGRG